VLFLFNPLYFQNPNILNRSIQFTGFYHRNIAGNFNSVNHFAKNGVVIEGMDIVDKIAGVATDKNDRPALDIKIIKAEIIKP
jgi:cyclophilin family peptidyl-prolyl cis-trans isomerase